MFAKFLLLLTYCLSLPLLFMVVCSRFLFCYAVFCVLSTFAITSLGKSKLVDILSLSSRCRVSVIVLCLFYTVPWVSRQFVIVAFPGYTHIHLGGIPVMSLKGIKETKRLKELQNPVSQVRSHRDNVWVLGDFNMPKMTWPESVPKFKPECSHKQV